MDCRLINAVDIDSKYTMKTSIALLTIALIAVCGFVLAGPIAVMTYEWSSEYLHLEVGGRSYYSESPHPFPKDWDWEISKRDGENFSASRLAVSHTSEELILSGGSDNEGKSIADSHFQIQFRCNASTLKIQCDSSISPVSYLKFKIYEIRSEVHHPILVFESDDVSELKRYIPVKPGGKYRLVGEHICKHGAQIENGSDYYLIQIGK